jgi:hypothetical protein
MDMAILGEQIVASEAAQYFTAFWMPAGGNNGVAGCEVFYNSSASSFDVQIETKSSDQEDINAQVIGSATITAAGSTVATYKCDVSNAKDLVRYVLKSLKGNVRVHLQFAQPMWNPN